MSDHTFCRMLLKTSRLDLNRNPKIKSMLKGMSTWKTSYGVNTYFEVWTENGIVWSGTACCAYEAKYNAITKYLEADESN